MGWASHLTYRETSQISTCQSTQSFEPVALLVLQVSLGSALGTAGGGTGGEPTPIVGAAGQV